MTYKFTFPTKGNKTPSLNEYIRAERTRLKTRNGKFITLGAVMKKEWQEKIAIEILNQLRNAKAKSPLIVHYHYFEANDNRDVGNIHAPFQKFCEDAMQDCGLIVNDNQKNIKGFTALFSIDKENPRIEVEVEEVTDEEGK